MRATTAFNRIIAIDGVVVEGVTFTPEGVVVRIRRRRRSHQCPCGWTTRAHYDRSTRRWRHLDLELANCFLEAEICRIDCPKYRRVRTEDVPWARPGARHTKAFCSVVAWLAQRVDTTTITKLLRVSWEAVAKIVVNVVTCSTTVVSRDRPASESTRSLIARVIAASPWSLTTTNRVGSSGPTRARMPAPSAPSTTRSGRSA